MKRLLVNADDLGRSPGVDRGIVAAHERGIVTAATLMTNTPDSEHAAALAREHPALDVGVHLVLTFARPLTDPARIPSLVEPGGSFPRSPVVGRGRSRSKRARRSAVAEEALIEYRAQYARARELLGREPSHLDSHHFVHDEPALEWALGELARETGAAARPQSDRQRDAFRAKGIRTVDRFDRSFQFAGHIDVDSLVAMLREIAERGDGSTELMCHPGEPDAELLGGSSYARERATELATLTDPRVRRAVEKRGLVLSTFADLA